MFDFLNRYKNNVEISQRKKQRVEYKLVGSMKHKPGLTLFAINTKTLAVHEAEYVKNDCLSWLDALNIVRGIIKRKVQIEKDCVYIEAINASNALRKYNKLKKK